MPAKKISELKTLTVASGNEYIPVVEKGMTYKMDMNTVAAYLQDAINASGTSDYYYNGDRKASANVVSISGDGCSVEVDSNNDKQVNIVIPESSLEFSINNDITTDRIKGIHFISPRFSKEINSGSVSLTLNDELPTSANENEVLGWDGSKWVAMNSSMSKILIDVDGSNDQYVSKISVLTSNGLSAQLNNGVATLKKIRTNTDGISSLIGDVSATIGSSPSTISTVIKLRGKDVSDDVPEANDILTFYNNKWTPRPSTSSTFFGDVSATTGNDGISATIVGIRNIQIENKSPVAGNYLSYDSSQKKLIWTTAQTPSVTISDVQAQIANFKESATINTSTNLTAINVYVNSSKFHYFSNNYLNDYIINIKSTASTSLNTYLTNNGQTITVVVLVQNSATVRKLTKLTIDGVEQTVKWQENLDGRAPVGNPNSIHSWCFSIMRTGSSSYLVLGSLTNFS